MHSIRSKLKEAGIFVKYGGAHTVIHDTKYIWKIYVLIK